MQNIVKNNVTITFSTDFIRLVLWIDWCIVGFLTKMYNSARINGQLKLSVSNSLLHCAQLRLQVISKASVWDPFFFFSLEVMLSGLSNTVICFQLTSISLTYATNIRKNRSVRKCHFAECRMFSTENEGHQPTTKIRPHIYCRGFQWRINQYK